MLISKPVHFHSEILLVYVKQTNKKEQKQNRKTKVNSVKMFQRPNLLIIKAFKFRGGIKIILFLLFDMKYLSVRKMIMMKDSTLGGRI